MERSKFPPKWDDLLIWYKCWFTISQENASSVKTLTVQNGQHALSTQQTSELVSRNEKIPFSHIHINKLNACEVTCSSFLLYSLLMSKTNSTALGFTRSGGMSAILVVASAVVLLLRIAWTCKGTIKLRQAKRINIFSQKSNLITFIFNAWAFSN